MRTLTLHNRFQGNTTIVENDFIDHYMAKANGEYVKVYLLLLRYLDAHNTSLTISQLADCLECTEKDILRAFKYWSKVELLKIDYDEAGTICGLSVGKSTENEEHIESVKLGVMETFESVAIQTAPKKIAPKSSSSKYQNELKQLYFVAEQYIGKPLTSTDINKINYFFDSLNFSIDLIEYLIEYCVENNHKSMHYIEKVALAWADEQITTIEEAKAKTTLYNKNYFSILNAFGIKGRSPAAIELNYMKKWMEEYGFTVDIIVEACNRTIANTHQPDFKYADTILKNWIAKDVHHFSDITRLDLAYQQEKASKKRVSSKSAIPAGNRFNNFENRAYDMNCLEQQLLNTN